LWGKRVLFLWKSGLELEEIAYRLRVRPRTVAKTLTAAGIEPTDSARHTGQATKGDVAL
jgi:hypothetical protein